MAGEWVDAALGDLIDIEHGCAFQGEYFHDEPPGDVLLTPGNFAIGGGFKTDKFKYYRGPVPADFVLGAGDLLVTMTDLSKATDTLGYPALVPPPVSGARFLHNQRLGKVVIKTRAPVEKSFLYYLLCSREYRNEVLASATGTTVKHTSPNRIKRFQFQRPPIPEQRAIAQILGTLDDKIELNRRLSETLEAIARAIFKSWFVDFDPVRAKAEGRDPGLPKRLADLFPDRFEDSELGKIPKGWEVGRLDELLAELVSGARPKGGAVDEGIPSIGAENIIGLGRYDFSKEKFVPLHFFEQLKSKGASIRPGDVLLYKDGAQIGRKTYFDRGFPHRESAINEHVFILRAKHPWMQRFMFFWLDLPSMTSEIISLNSNSAQPGINQAGVRQLPLLLPSPAVVEAFERLVAPLTDEIFEHCKQSRTLAALRDTLLPKLISGELRVRQMEPEAA